MNDEEGYYFQRMKEEQSSPSWRPAADPEPETFFLVVSKSFSDPEEFDPTHLD